MADIPAGRMKNWGELDDKGKIERLRQEIRGLISFAETMRPKMEDIQRHSHNDGKVVTPINNNYRGTAAMMMARPNSDDQYI